MIAKIVFFSLQIILIMADGPVRPAYPDQTDADFQNQCLQGLNAKRALHQNTFPLKTSQDVVSYAQSRCKNASTYNFLDEGHRGCDGAHGENMYWGGYGDATPANCADAVGMWYDEEKDYNYDKPGFGYNTGHFTAMVWAATTDVGCARCGGGPNSDGYYEEYIVCNFVRPGNVNTAAQFSSNVNRKNQ